MIDNSEKFLTALELSATLGVAPATIWRRCRDRSIPFHEFGGSYRFLLSEVIECTRREIEEKTKGRKANGKADPAKS